MKSIIPALLLLFPLVSSHFTLDSPKARGFDEDKLGTFPCGGQDTVSANRIPWPLVGGPIQLTMEHDQTIVQVLLSLGNNPGSNFNIILQPTLQEQGIGQFCLGDVVVPTSLGIKSGDNATIQVVTNGDTSGGLYNCADITFQTSVPNLECKNGTGVKTTAYTGKANTNANGTTAFGASSPSGTATTSSASRSSAASTAGSGTAAPAATKSSVAAARSLERGVWGLMGVVLGGAVALV